MEHNFTGLFIGCDAMQSARSVLRCTIRIKLSREICKPDRYEARM